MQCVFFLNFAKRWTSDSTLMKFYSTVSTNLVASYFVEHHSLTASEN